MPSRNRAFISMFLTHSGAISWLWLNSGSRGVELEWTNLEVCHYVFRYLRRRL